jgi:predicted DNA-binding transcriptional regulator AlpA
MHMSYPKALIHQGIFTNVRPITLLTLHSSECVRIQNCSNPTIFDWLTQKVAFTKLPRQSNLTGRVTDWSLTDGHESALAVTSISEEIATSILSVSYGDESNMLLRNGGDHPRLQHLISYILKLDFLMLLSFKIL